MPSPSASNHAMLCGEKCKRDGIDVHKAVNKPIHFSLHLVHGCKTRGRSRSDSFTIQTLE